VHARSTRCLVAVATFGACPDDAASGEHIVLRLDGHLMHAIADRS